MFWDLTVLWWLSALFLIRDDSFLNEIEDESIRKEFIDEIQPQADTKLDVLKDKIKSHFSVSIKPSTVASMNLGQSLQKTATDCEMKYQQNLWWLCSDEGWRSVVRKCFYDFDFDKICVHFCIGRSRFHLQMRICSRRKALLWLHDEKGTTKIETGWKLLKNSWGIFVDRYLFIYLVNILFCILTCFEAFKLKVHFEVIIKSLTVHWT